MNKTPLILFAKAPIEGKVKTRLQSHCSPRQASEIAEILLEECIIKTTRAWSGDVFLSVWLDHEHEFIQLMEQRYPIKLVQQCAGDLGAKMADALDRFGYPAAVMGCDVPHVPDETLREAYQLLNKGQSVLGPSNDGGYYLLGLQAPQSVIFNDMEWGVSSVLATTLQRANHAELIFSKLGALNDIDEWSDVLLAAQQVPSLARYLQREAL